MRLCENTDVSMWRSEANLRGGSVMFWESLSFLSAAGAMRFPGRLLSLPPSSPWARWDYRCVLYHVQLVEIAFYVFCFCLFVFKLSFKNL